jgi:chromosome segregation ATPase
MTRFGSDDLLHTALSLSLKVQELCEQASQRTAQNSTEKRSNSATRAAHRQSSFFSSTIYRGQGAGVGGGGGGQDSRAGRKAPGSPMTSLIDKVKQLEGDLTAMGGAPQQQLGLLRDLHCRAVDIEHLMTDSLSDQQTVWIAERESLSQALHDSKNQIQDLKHTHDGAVVALRTRYQSMLDQAQGALEIQTRAARAQIDRLEEALRRAQQEAQMERLRTPSSAQHVERDSRERSEGAAEVASYRVEGASFRAEGDRRAVEPGDTRISSPMPSPMPSPSQAEALQSSIAAINRSHIEEVLALKRLVKQTNDELESARAASREAQSTHTAELQDLLREITAQNESHDDTVAVLEGSIKEMQDDIFQLRASPDRSPALLRSDSREQDLVEALGAAEVQIHQIEHRYELKCDELEALVRYAR